VGGKDGVVQKGIVKRGVKNYFFGGITYIGDFEQMEPVGVRTDDRPCGVCSERNFPVANLPDIGLREGSKTNVKGRVGNTPQKRNLWEQAVGLDIKEWQQNRTLKM